jgi:hypothetical protein
MLENSVLRRDAFALIAHADILHLRDGRTERGTFISGNGREIRFLAEGGRSQRYDISAIDHLTFGKAAPETARTRTSDTVVPSGTTSLCG